MENYSRIGLGILVFKDKKVLLGKRLGPVGAGEWSLPGGKLEPFESLVDCAIRETKEETNLRIKNLKLTSVLDKVPDNAQTHWITIVFSSDYESGELMVTEPDKFESWAWFSLNNLPQPMFAMSNQAINLYQIGQNYFK